MPASLASRRRLPPHRNIIAALGLFLGPAPLLAAGPPGPPRPTWAPPLSQHAVIEGFRQPSHDWVAGHRGVDFAAQAGDPVRAIGAGTVAFVGSIAGKPVVTIDHPAGLRSTYEPVIASVTLGQAIDIGQVIGQVAAGGGHCAGRCLHLGVRQRGTPGGEPGPHYVDPLALLRPRAVLKPL